MELIGGLSIATSSKLRRSILSKVIDGNPEVLIHLRPSLLSKAMFTLFENAESVLDLQEADRPEIYNDVVEELS